jgi:NADPH:quinone reductase-like Zn-dependent oxidoreductase
VGRIVDTGSKVTQFKTGDTVLGDILYYWGGLAEYVCAPKKLLITKPESLSYEQAVTLPQAAIVALQGLKNKDRLKPGTKVLITGAGGGAGCFAIQLAKQLGCHVTAVDSSKKQATMHQLGADRTIDYTVEDFTTHRKSYDYILDLIATHPVLHYKRALAPGGSYLMVGGSVPSLLKTML